jgi:NTE family protein
MAGGPERDYDVGLVLAGGGARGAYEIGALSELLPRLNAEDRPNIIAGTSIGAINAAYLAATADQDPADSLRGARALWRRIRWGDALREIGSREDLLLKLRLAADLFRVRDVHAWSVFDTAPFARSLERMLRDAPLSKIHENIHNGNLGAAAVVATRASTSLSTVFFDSCLDEPRADSHRGIHYQRAEIELDHILASAAMPILFPSRKVERPAEAQGWYTDGGIRLNTPIKPALGLGAKRVIIIGLHCAELSKRAEGGDRPDVLIGASELMQALLTDPLVNDVHNLVMVNQVVRACVGDSPPPHEVAYAAHEGVVFREVPYILIAPDNPYEIGRIAAKHYVERYKGIENIARRDRSVAKLARLLDVDQKEDFVRGELLSYLFFDEAFANELMELGRRDAGEWLRKTGTDNPWMTVHHPPLTIEAVNERNAQNERDEQIKASGPGSNGPGDGPDGGPGAPSEIPAGERDG